MFYRLLELSLAPLLRLLFRPWVEGLENIPDEGAALLVSNHLSFSDSFLLPAVIRRKVTFLAKNDYFTGRGVKGRLMAGFFRGAGQIPLDRTNGRAAEATLVTGLRVLSEGHLLGIYPEGTRSPDGRLYRGRMGVARLALQSGVPVIPCALIGTDEIQPPGRKVPKIRRIGLRVGRPLDFSRYDATTSNKYVLRSVTDELMYAIMRLSGQEYVDIYATKAKAEIAATARRGRDSGGGTGTGPGAAAPGPGVPDQGAPEDPGPPAGPGAPAAEAGARGPAPEGAPVR